MEGAVDELADYKQKLCEDAENLLTKCLPGRVKELEVFNTNFYHFMTDQATLQTLLGSPEFSSTNPERVIQDLNIPIPPPESETNGDSEESASKKRKLEEVSEDLEGSKVFVLPNGIVKKNAYITKLLQVVKPHLRQLVHDTNLLKMWIRFKV